MEDRMPKMCVLLLLLLRSCACMWGTKAGKASEKHEHAVLRSVRYKARCRGGSRKGNHSSTVKVIGRCCSLCLGHESAHFRDWAIDNLPLLKIIIWNYYFSCIFCWITLEEWQREIRSLFKVMCFPTWRHSTGRSVRWHHDIMVCSLLLTISSA